MIVFGHRGAAGHAPENTLRAIRLALDFGVDGIEVDVRQVDDTLIVLHDESLARTTSGSGHYKTMRLADLRALDAGNGERIPLLSEVLEVVLGRADLNVEVKEAGLAATLLAALHDCVPQAEHGRLLLSSFDNATTAELASGRGAMRLGVLYEGAFETALARAQALSAWSLNLPLAHVTPASIAATHVAGLRALVYTVNRQTDIEHCQAAGVDGVFSDFPDRVIAFKRASNGGAR